jgi:hypothetical protein
MIGDRAPRRHPGSSTLKGCRGRPKVAHSAASGSSHSPHGDWIPRGLFNDYYDS